MDNYRLNVLIKKVNSRDYVDPGMKMETYWMNVLINMKCV